MRHPSFEFVDGAFGSLSARNNPTRLSEIQANMKRVNSRECFCSYFRYEKSFADYVKRTGSVRGYKGRMYSDIWPCDVDSTDLSVSLDRTRRIVDYLLSKDVPEQDLKVSFSGAKGFHVCLASTLFDLAPMEGLDQVYKVMARILSKDMEVDIDPTIYDAMRLFRLENSLNQKSGLYKIPLTVEELFTLTVDEIKELAKQPRILSAPVRVGIPNDYLMGVFLAALESTEKKQQVKINGNREAVVGRHAKPCIARLLAGVSESNPGRNNAAMRLAVHYKKEGMPAEAVLGLLKGWNENNGPPLDEAALGQVVEHVFSGKYDFGCNDAILRAFCGPDCIMHKRKEERQAQCKDMAPLASLVESYAESLNRTGRIFLGIPEIDTATRGMVPGEVVMLMARSGVGKTAAVLHTLFSKPSEVPAIFFSMEMPATQIFERAASMVTGLGAEDLEGLMQDPDERAAVSKIVAEKFQNVYIVDKDALTIKEIEKYIDAAEKEVLHQKVRLVIIDHLGRMVRGGKPEYEELSALARGMKQLAKDREVIVYDVVQVGREQGGDGTIELGLSAARGSGQIEEGADLLLAMWRPDLKDQNRDWDVAKIAAVKNRKGRLVQTSMIFHRSTLRFEPDTRKGKRNPACDI